MSDLVGNPEDRFSQNEAHIANLIYCQGCLNTIFQIIKVGQHIFKHLHKEKELIPQGFFQPFWEGVLGPFASNGKFSVF